MRLWWLVSAALGRRRLLLTTSSPISAILLPLQLHPLHVEPNAEMAVDLSQQQQLQLQLQHVRDVRRRQLDYTRRHAPTNSGGHNSSSDSNSTASKISRQPMQAQPSAGGAIHDNLLVDPSDYDAIDQEDDSVPAFESACLHDDLSTVESITSPPNPPRTQFFLYNGLFIALRAGSVHVTRRLLSAGAPLLRQTPEHVLSAPLDRQIPLFEVLLDYGWTVNTPGLYGATLLTRVLNNAPLLQWFLAHGADPNIGEQKYYRDRNGDSDTDSCLALERVSGDGNLEVARILLDASAKIQNGSPLYFAAGACPQGMNPHVGRVTPSKEFDVSRIPVMAFLVEHGADINEALKARYMTAKYPIVNAVMVGAVERVKWLLERGADPEAKGAFGSAVVYAKACGSAEMQSVIEEMINAKE